MLCLCVAHEQKGEAAGPQATLSCVRVDSRPGSVALGMLYCYCECSPSWWSLSLMFLTNVLDYMQLSGDHTQPSFISPL